ncbi:MAG TPA: zinc ABC transporter substrate-binding protein [Candidatus Cybelea sp.]|nr:zinc ABC transporter substrate-binding protein [Candidatus Cybelea sp.]
MGSARVAAAVFAACLPVAAASAAGAPVVVTSILPVQGLAAGVMDGVGAPYLIVRGGASPHEYSLKPEDARNLEHADVIVWVGPVMEAFLSGATKNASKHAKIIELDRVPGMKLWPARAGGPWEPDADEPLPPPSGAAIDGHLWLDPGNAATAVTAIESTLSRIDPAHAASYHANADRMREGLAALDNDLARELTPVRKEPFIVFHDAYQYLERRYELNAVGSVTISPEQQPGARRLREIRRKIGELGARCVFREPEFEPRLLATVIGDAKVRRGTLDPEGADIEPGPDAYFELMRRLGSALAGCLAGTS